MGENPVLWGGVPDRDSSLIQRHRKGGGIFDDLNRLSGGLRLKKCFRHNGDQRRANMMNGLCSQGRIGWNMHGLAICGVGQTRGCKQADALRCQVICGQNRQHTRHCPCRLQIL